jgi:hypothetical protein
MCNGDTASAVNIVRHSLLVATAVGITPACPEGGTCLEAHR